LPNIKKLKPLAGLRYRVETIMRHEGWYNQQWFYKGAKMCLIWPEFMHAFPDALWVIVRRDDRDIVNSCLKTGFMKAYKSPEGWQNWVDHHKERFEEMHGAGLDIMEVWPSKFVGGDFSELQETIDWLGLEWNERQILNFIEPALWSVRDGKSNSN